MGEAFIVRKGGGLGFEFESFASGNEFVATNEANISFVGNTNSYGVQIQGNTIDNDFIYVVGEGQGPVKVFRKDNLAFVGATNDYGDRNLTVQVDNDFIYSGGRGTSQIKRWHKGNLVFDAQSAGAGGFINNLQLDGDFIYTGISGTAGTKKWHRGNLALSATANNTIAVGKLRVDNSFVYGVGDNTVQKFHKSNMVLATSGANYGSFTQSIDIDSDFAYVGGRDGGIAKYHIGNLTIDSQINTGLTAVDIASTTLFEDFVYIGTSGGFARKHHKGNLVFVAQTNSYTGELTGDVAVESQFIYIGGNKGAASDIQKHTRAEGNFVEVNDPEGKVIVNSTTYIKESLI